MIPLKITAIMQDRVIYYGDGMHLDGPLSYGAYRDLSESERQALPPISDEWALDFDLPLLRWAVETPLSGREEPRLLNDQGRAWGWCCSAAHADWSATSGHSVRKRPDTDRMVRLGRDVSVNLSGGQIKACDLKLPARWARQIVWYAVGDPNEVRRLLGLVHAIGKLSHQGCGLVGEWRVEGWPYDWSIERNGRLTRVMPWGYRPDGGGIGDQLTIRAPYHHRSRRVLALRPDYEELRP